MGGSLYELPPGQSICPYHYEYPEEEWLVVVTTDHGGSWVGDPSEYEGLSYQDASYKGNHGLDTAIQRRIFLIVSRHFLALVQIIISIRLSIVFCPVEWRFYSNECSFYSYSTASSNGGSGSLYFGLSL